MHKLNGFRSNARNASKCQGKSYKELYVGNGHAGLETVILLTFSESFLLIHSTGVNAGANTRTEPGRRLRARNSMVDATDKHLHQAGCVPGKLQMEMQIERLQRLELHVRAEGHARTVSGSQA